MTFVYKSTRRPGEESDVESSRETSSAGSSDCEAERRAKSVVDGSCSHQKLVNLNSQRMNRLSLREKSVMSSSSDEAEMSSSPGTLLFEFLEHEQPYNRRPLTDKASSLLGDYCIQVDLRSVHINSSDHPSPFHRFHFLHLSFQILGVVIYYLQVGFQWLGMHSAKYEYTSLEVQNFFPLILTLRILW